MKLQSRSNRLGIILFLIPILVLFSMYFLYPLGFVFFTSFLDWNGVADPVFVGIKNFIDLFNNPTFRLSFLNNIIWVLSLGFVQIGLATVMAMILARKPRGWRVYRTVYFIPNVISQVAIAAMWAAIYNAEYGAINKFLETLGLESWTRNWLGELGTALPAVLFQQVLYLGYFMIIILAARLNFSENYYEAAEIDGASVVQQELFITLPLLRPITVITMTLAMVYGLRHFEATFLLTNGGPANRTSVLGIQLYKNLASLNYGEANAIGVFLVLVGILVIFLVRTIGRKWTEKVE